MGMPPYSPGLRTWSDLYIINSSEVWTTSGIMVVIQYKSIDQLATFLSLSDFVAMETMLCRYMV